MAGECTAPSIVYLLESKAEQLSFSSLHHSPATPQQLPSNCFTLTELERYSTKQGQSMGKAITAFQNTVNTWCGLADDHSVSVLLS